MPWLVMQCDRLHTAQGMALGRCVGGREPPQGAQNKARDATNCVDCQGRDGDGGAVLRKGRSLEERREGRRHAQPD